MVKVFVFRRSISDFFFPYFFPIFYFHPTYLCQLLHWSVFYFLQWFLSRNWKTWGIRITRFILEWKWLIIFFFSFLQFMLQFWMHLTINSFYYFALFVFQKLTFFEKFNFLTQNCFFNMDWQRASQFEHLPSNPSQYLSSSLKLFLFFF